MGQGEAYSNIAMINVGKKSAGFPFKPGKTRVWLGPAVEREYFFSGTTTRGGQDEEKKKRCVSRGTWRTVAWVQINPLKNLR